MNILGINGSIGWDGNIPMPLDVLGEMWVHGSGATLIIDGELKNSTCEERFSRIKYDGNYPTLSIQHILEHNNLKPDDIDIVTHVGNSCQINFQLRASGYMEGKLKENFPNCKVEFVSHHLAHQGGTFYTSGFDSSNIFSFDGAGDHVFVNDRWRVPHFMFSLGEGKNINEITSGFCNDPDSFLGAMYGYLSAIAYKSKMNMPETDSEWLGSTHDTYESNRFCWLIPDRETYPGKVMGLASYGDYTKIDLPDTFHLDESATFPVLHNNYEWASIYMEDLRKFNPDDLAAWNQHQFEKHLMGILRRIPEKIKSDNLCLGGGCALNILANTKILEEGIYKNVHINTAPSDDGLHFGAALCKAAEHEEEIILNDNIAYLGIPYTDIDIEEVINTLN